MAPKNQDGKRLCATCNPYSKTVSAYDEKRVESRVNKFLCEKYSSEAFPIGTYAPFRSCGDNKRPDTILHFAEERHAFIIETDEHFHKEYDQSCEWSKILNHAQSLLQTFDLLYVTVIRFNPDAWKVAGKTTRYSFENRLRRLQEVIEECVSGKYRDRTFTFFQMFYPTDTMDDIVVEASAATVEAWFSKLQPEVCA